MHFDLAKIATADAYKLLVSTVLPRPIALATTVDAEGRVNAAPFSFFTARPTPSAGTRPIDGLDHAPRPS
jgi:flavin reductase (DIM6/NTAB) family NADH-FMN oxidoreductase RutF